MLALTRINPKQIAKAILENNKPNHHRSNVDFLMIVRFETELGNIRVRLEPEKAALTVQNFLGYVERGAYTDSSFYRVVHEYNQDHQPVKIAVVQGGLGMGDHAHKVAPIAHQTTLETGLQHLDGTISMSRLEPGSANAEFFFCIGAQPELDYGGARNPDGQGFAAFGQAIDGFEVLREVWRKPDRGQFLEQPVRIRLVVLE
jgi:peptidyl-prolyl cis-trans isomerase A (cyclophilin A)